MVESPAIWTSAAVGSADVTALYPSIDIEFAAAKVGDMFVESGIEVADVDIE